MILVVFTVPSNSRLMCLRPFKMVALSTVYEVFIAPGPLPDTVKDFWQMIWDHKLQTIVMLTKPVEVGTPKCAVYWPEKVNETLVLKPLLHVRMTYLQYFADFDMRAFEVTNVSNK